MKILSRANMRLNRIKKGFGKILEDKEKVNVAQEIRKVLSDKEYSVWIKKLSKCGSPEEQELITADYFKEIGKYDKLKTIVRII